MATKGSKSVKTEPSLAKAFIARLATARADDKGYKKEIVGQTDNRIAVCQGKDGHFYPQWLPPGSNPKYAFRMKSVAKLKQLRADFDKYIQVAEVIEEMEALNHPEAKQAGPAQKEAGTLQMAFK